MLPHFGDHPYSYSVAERSTEEPEFFMTTQWTHNLGWQTGENRRALRCPSIALKGHVLVGRMSKDTGGSIAPAAPPG